MENAKLMRELSILRIEDDVYSMTRDWTIEEYPFGIYEDGRLMAEYNCTPMDLEDLTAGALFCHGRITDRSDIHSLEVFAEDGEAHVVLTEPQQGKNRSGCEEPTGEFGVLELVPEQILQMMRENLQPSPLFQKTGGVHNVSLYGGENFQRIVRREDAARHNAVDKVLGYAVLHEIPMANTILAVSGRVSGEILEKAKAAKIPVVLSKAAPTVQSVEKAWQAGITLIGFIRDKRMNVYTHPERVKSPCGMYAQMAKAKRQETVCRDQHIVRKR